MAKKPATKSPTAAPSKAIASRSHVVSSTPVRNTPLPKVSVGSPSRKEITHDQIARRAYQIHLSKTGGSESDNWHRAERELRGL